MVQLDQVTVPKRNGRRRMRSDDVRRESLLCVANFPANTGYAWDFIEDLYAQIANELAARDVTTWVAYPVMAHPPATLANSSARSIELPFSLSGAKHIGDILSFIKQKNVRAMYLCDRASWHPAYLAFRLAGVRNILVHDHASGARTVPRGTKRFLKRARMAVPGMTADTVVAVSDYVAARKVAVDLVPAKRVKRVWNSVSDPGNGISRRMLLHASFDIPSERPVIACACRATPEKGVDVLLRAFERVHAIAESRPVLLFVGNGPAFEELRELRDSLGSRADIIFAGYRADAAELIGGADVCVVPSVWQEAFGLSALEPMVRGVPVIASRVGGLPEVVGDDGGRLVEPANDERLAAEILDLLCDPGERRRIGQNGRARALRLFSREAQVKQLCTLIEAAFE